MFVQLKVENYIFSVFITKLRIQILKLLDAFKIQPSNHFNFNFYQIKSNFNYVWFREIVRKKVNIIRHK